MHARLIYASEQSKNTHPTKWPLFTTKFLPILINRHPHHRLLISTESCYCCFVLFQTSAFNHSNYRCKDWCISQSCAFHFNVIQESNLRLFIHPIERMMIALIVAASSVVSSLHFEKRKNKVLGDELIMLLLFKDYCKLTYPPPPPPYPYCKESTFEKKKTTKS